VPYAVIFPGQGAAAPGAGRPWVDHQAWDVVGQAEAVLDRPLARLLLEADAAELAATGASQLAVLLTSLVTWDALAPRLDEAPVAFAGHSLGQITPSTGAMDSGWPPAGPTCPRPRPMRGPGVWRRWWE
jgi:malonyl CoA-acyl carrier protein transacylase